MSAPAVRRSMIGIVLAAAGLCVALGQREMHHWDEPGYLYAAAHFTPAALARGDFESGNVPGFFAGKIGHVALLRGLIQRLGTSLRAIRVMQVVYTAQVLLACGLLAMFVAVLWKDAGHAAAVAAVALVTPVSVYLAPKLLSEVPAFAAAGASLACWATALTAARRAQAAAWIIASGCALAYGLMARETIGLMAGGAWLAAWAARPSGLSRRRIAWSAAAVLGVAVGVLVFSEVVLGLRLDRAVQHGHAFGVSVSPLGHWLKRSAFAFGPLLLAVPLAFASRRVPLVRFYAVWFLCSGVIILLMLRHMEERFLVTSVPAVAGLVVLGGEAVWHRLRGRVPAVAGLAVAAAVMVAGNLAIQPRTAQTINTAFCAKAVEWLRTEHPGRPVVVASRMDFHLLRVAFPDVPFYLADSTMLLAPASKEDIRQGRAQMLVDTYLKRVDVDPHRWYGERYIGGVADLRRLGEPPWLFMARKPNRAYSWMWESPALTMTAEVKVGRYLVYDTEQAALADASAGADNVMGNR